MTFLKSSILSVGTELLFGQIINTNTVYLSRQLNLLGIDVMSHHTVGDNSDRLADMIRQTFKECDLILTTGGLGPTQDDLTKEIACEVLHDTLVVHEPTRIWLSEYFSKLGRKITDNNWKQADFPSRATIFENEVGTAPGFALEEDGKTIICMPGPPREMKHMYENHVKPYLMEKTKAVIYYRMLRMFGIGESQLETDLLDLIDGQTDPTLATYAKEGECSLRIASKQPTIEEAKRSVEDMIKKVEQKVGQYIYSYDDEEFHNAVGRKLIERNISISCAESCTGGLFAMSLTSVSGISAVFDRGIVTYSNQAKIEELGVRKDTLDRCGAVSAETAEEMARGIRTVSGSRLGVSVTGIAGPEGGTPEKPVGLVYICAILDDRKIDIERHIRNVNRDWNRNYAKLLMFDAVNRLLDGKE